MVKNQEEEHPTMILEDDGFLDVLGNMEEMVAKATEIDDAHELVPEPVSISTKAKPKPRGKSLTYSKQKTARRLYAQKRDGDAFIDNNLVMYAANQAAKEMAHTQAKREDVEAKAKALVIVNRFDLTEPQKTTFIDYIQRRIGDFEALTRIDAAVLNENDKDLWFLWGLIKRDFALDDKIIRGREQWRKLLKVGPNKVTKLFDVLIRLEAVRKLAPGIKGATSRRATEYKRLV